MKNEVVNIIRDVINDVKGKLPVENINDAHELLDHDEWGEALSLIYTQLYEYDEEISQETFEQIKLAGEKMGLDSKGWEVLGVKS